MLGQPRFLLLQGAARRLSSPIPPEADGTSAVAWRLVSANNRELGRSAVYHWGADACVRAVSDLVRSLDEVQTRLSRNPVTGLWAWVLTQDGEPVAMSGRGYRRESEVRDCLDNFRITAPIAQVNPVAQHAVRGISALDAPGPGWMLR